MRRVGIDAMGGDMAPEAVVKAAVSALSRLKKDSIIVLFGDEGAILPLLQATDYDPARIEIVHCTEQITMQDHPAVAFSKKSDSSITVGFSHLKEGKIDGFASAGNTGAMLVGSMYTSETIRNVIRPAISALISTVDGGNVLLLDVGINVDCKPDVLYQYGVIGNIYAQAVLGKISPRVALLNIGEEREKGNLAAKATYELMEQQSGIFDFVGNIEANELLTGRVADVVVCDGFVGNTMLKQAEGFYEIAKSQGIIDPYIDKLNYEVVGGTPVLGINSIVFIGHGRSSEFAIENMIVQTEIAIRSGLVEKLQATFNKI